MSFQSIQGQRDAFEDRDTEHAMVTLLEVSRS